MELLTDDLRQRLPCIRRFHNPSDEEHYVIYARFFTPTSGVVFYVAEGEQQTSDYVFWGFLLAPQFAFPARFEINLGRLGSSDWLGQEPCQRDEEFQLTVWKSIIRFTPMFRPPF